MLITRFMTPDGVGEVLDFMPVIEGGPTDRHRLVRHLRVARGTMQFAVDFQPRFDYGRAGHSMEFSETGAVFRGDDGMELTLHSRADRACEGRAVIERAGDGLRATFTMREGQSGRGWCWSPWAASRGPSSRPNSSGSPTTPPRSGRPGWAARPTPAAGGRWSPGRR